MTPYPNDGCPNCDPDHAPATGAAREWLTPNCWGRGHYHPYVEHDFHETADMLIKVEREAAQQALPEGWVVLDLLSDDVFRAASEHGAQQERERIGKVWDECAPVGSAIGAPWVRDFVREAFDPEDAE